MTPIVHDFQFLRPLWLLGLLAIPPLLWWLRRSRLRRNVWRDAVDAHLLPHLLQGGAGATGGWRVMLPLFLMVFTMGCDKSETVDPGHAEVVYSIVAAEKVTLTSELPGRVSALSWASPSSSLSAACRAACGVMVRAPGVIGRGFGFRLG